MWAAIIPLLERAVLMAGRSSATAAATAPRGWAAVAKMMQSDKEKKAAAAQVKAATDFIKSTIEAASLEQQSLKKIEAYTSHTAQSRRMVGELQALKNSTMLGDSVFENAATLLNHGVGEAEIAKDMRQLADLARGDEKSMKQLALTFAQVKEKGLLMRTEFDEFKNAGFDPIREMAEHWDQFGFKVKMSEGQLRSLMEQGKITAAQLSKAMEIATSAGGSHAGGLQGLQDTSAGKDAVLDAEVNTFNANVGSWLLPIKDAFTDLGTWMMHAVNKWTSKSVAEKLGDERKDLSDRVSGALMLSKGGVARTNLLAQLQQQYPNYFKGINAATADDGQLRAILSTIQKDYGSQISGTNHKETADKMTSDYNRMMDIGERAKTQAALIRSGSKLRVLSNSEYSQLTANHAYEKGDKIYRPEQLLDGYASDYLTRAEQLKPKMLAANNAVAYDNKTHSAATTISRVNMLLGDENARKDLWGKDAKTNYAALQQEAARYNKVRTASGGRYTGSLLNYDYGGFNKLLEWQKKPTASGGNAAADTSAAITGGGRKMVTINLNQPMVGKQEFHVGSMQEAAEIGLNEFRERYLRVLQGAVASL